MGLGLLSVEFHFYDNPLLRIGVLAVFFILGRLFYNFIKPDEEENNYNIQDDSHKGDLKKKIAISLVVLIFVSFILLVIAAGISSLTNIDSFNDSNDSNDYNNTFSNENISFTYPSVFVEEEDNNYTFIAFNDYDSIVLWVIDSEGYGLDAILNEEINELSENSSFEILSYNETKVDNIKAYDLSVHVKNDEEFYYRCLFFIYKGKVYTFRIQSQEIDDNNLFNQVISSIKLK